MPVNARIKWTITHNIDYQKPEYWPMAKKSWKEACRLSFQLFFADGAGASVMI